MPLSESICFKSEQFDYNAGNRFYGKDVAEHLANRLTKQGLASDYLDEDWGWLVMSSRGTAPEYQIAVYNLAEHGEGGRPGVPEWGLWVRSYERKKAFGFIPRRVEVQVAPRLRSAVTSAIRETGSQPEQWLQGPSGA
jgi:hypothetical protein